jgi:hypothetical protein
VTFIHTHRDRWGIEPICRVLAFAPATYHAAIARSPSARRVRDEALKPEITRVFTENLRVYGADKVWAQLRREGTGPWRGLDDVEYATLEYVDWFNQRRLHGEIGMIPPAEFEALYYHQGTRPCWPSPNNPSLYETRGGSVGAKSRGPD